MSATTIIFSRYRLFLLELTFNGHFYHLWLISEKEFLLDSKVTIIFTIIVASSSRTVNLLISLLIIEHFCVLFVYLHILTMPKRSSSSSATGSTGSTICDGCQKPFKRIQAHLSHNPACSSVYASRRTSLIDPYAGVGGNVIDSAAKDAQTMLRCPHLL
jgi:hypothetical protein